mgnify:CR=1 FL=1
MNLAFIPARKGSQGVPGKNTKELLGKPLIQWSIEQAQDARGVDEVWVSSDDPEVLAIARDCGAEPLLRPEEISGATAQIEESITYHLAVDQRRLSIDYILLLQPTSPNRTSIDIERALGHIRETDADSLVSMVATHTGHGIVTYHGSSPMTRGRDDRIFQRSFKKTATSIFSRGRDFAVIVCMEKRYHTVWNQIRHTRLIHHWTGLSWNRL